jgi:hypothetical protein
MGVRWQVRTSGNKVDNLMPRTCSVCKHPEADAINAAILRNDSFRTMASRFGMSTASLQRHKAAHIAEMLKKAKEAAEVIQAADLLESIRSLHARTLEILRSAEKEKRWETALKAIQQARNNLELLAKLDGQLKDREPGEITVVVQYIDKAIIAPSAKVNAQLLAPAERSE